MNDTHPFCFPIDAIPFLQDLKSNNNREWFHANKKIYESALKRPAAEFCRAFAQKLHLLTGTEHEHKIFRINRDIRFSKDKTPYNSHLRISFTPMVNSPIKPGWFFSLEPEQVVFGTGVFMLEKAQLETLRAKIDGNEGAKLSKIIVELQKSSIRISQPELKRVPTPFAKDHKRADLLRHKSFSAWVDFVDVSIATSPKLLDEMAEATVKLKPLYDWLLSKQ